MKFYGASFGAMILLAAFSQIDAESWQYFTFAQAWPPGTCTAAVHEHHVCRVPQNVSSWCVHGLWPSNYDKDDPEDCNDSMPFDFSQVAKLTSNLTKYWPNLYVDTKFDSFWAHEWTKHGTCCQDLQTTTGELNYFSSGLSLQQKYNIEQMLTKGNIIPSKYHTYYVDDFTTTIKQQTGYEPVVGCSSMRLENGTLYQVINELEICLTKQLVPTKCASDDMLESRGDHSDSLKFKSDHSMYSMTEHPEFVMYWWNGRWRSTNCPKDGFFYPPITYG